MEDPLGFTKQTAMILRGLGASALIPECKKRNLSSNTLHELNVEDLIRLGADTKKATEIKNALSIMKRKPHAIKTSSEDMIQNCLEIIKHGERHLSLMQAFAAYCRLRLSKERINFFIDPDKCLSASEVLPISINATLAEVEEAEQSLKELESLIGRVAGKKQKLFYPYLCAVISGLGLVTFLLLRVSYK